MSDDIRESVAAAFDQVSGSHSDTGDSSSGPVPQNDSAQPQEEQRDTVATGEQSPESTAKQQKITSSKPPSSPTVKSTESGQVSPVPQKQVKAPASWKPAAREKWAAIPPDIQSEILRREKEINTAMQSRAESSKMAEKINEVVRPYEAMMRAEGVDPIKGIESALRPFAILRTGSQAQKAALAASVILEWGIPLELINSALAGSPVQHQQPQGQGQEFKDPRFDQFMAELNQVRESRSQELMTRKSEEVEDFAGTHEFFDDVQEDVADLLELSIKKGIAPDLETIYKKAISMNPEISAIIEQRKAAEKIAQQNGAVRRSRIAASSVKSAPATSTAGSGPSDIRGIVEDAWDRLSR